METKQIRVEEVEEGDLVVIDGDACLIDDIRENGRMDGVWLHSGGLSRFYNYGDTVQLVLDGYAEEI